MKNGIYDTIIAYKNLKTGKTHLNLILFSLLTGAITGITVSLYTLFLSKITIIRNTILNISFFYLGIPLLVILFILSSIFIQHTLNKFPLISGSGIPQVMGLIQSKIKFNWFFELITKFFSGLLAIFMGFSLGREGPSIHLGALVGDGINKIFKRSEVQKKYLITCGASAGLSAAFNAPLAGAIFAIEELHKFFSPILIVCVLISSLFSNLISKFMLGTNLSFNNYLFISPLNFSLKTVFIHFILILILCIILMFFARLFNLFIISFKNFYNSIKINNYIKLIIFSLFSLLVIKFLPEVTGGGHHLVEELLDVHFSLKFLMVILFFKFIYTMASYSTGAPGGIFLPLLVIGALIGKIYGIILVDLFGFEQSYITLFVLIAMTSYFTAIVKTPITGIVLILEMSGNFSNLFSLVIAASITYAISELLKTKSVYELLFENMFEKNEKTEFNHKDDIVVLKIPILADSDLEGKKVLEVKWPNNFLLVGIERNNNNFIPNGHTVLQKSDILIVLTDENTSRNSIDIINKMAFNVEI